MTKKISIRHILIKLLYVMVFCLLIIAGGYVALSVILKNNDITYESSNFDFPSTLRIDGLKISSESLKIYIESMEIRWIWGALFRGRIEGDHLFITGAEVEQMPGETASNDSTSFDFPSMVLKTVIVKNSGYSMKQEGSTMLLLVPDLKMTYLKLGSSIEIDSLINANSDLKYTYNPSTANKPDTASAFSLDDIPGFSINALDFEQCGIVISNTKQRHAITELNLNFSGLKRDELLDMSVDHLSFVYQDTLKFDIGIDEGKIDDRDEILLTDLTLTLPGLDLSVPSLKIRNKDFFEIDAQIAASKINSSYLWLFISRENVPISHDIPIGLDGSVAYHGDNISFNKFTLNLPNKTSLTCDASFDLTGTRGKIDVDRALFATSLYDFSALFGRSISPDQKEIDLQADFEISGTYEDILIHGKTRLNSMDLAFNAAIAGRPDQSREISLDLDSDQIIPYLLYTGFPENTQADGISLMAAVRLDSADSPINMNISMKCDSMLVSGFRVVNPDVQLNSVRGKTTLFATSETRKVTMAIETMGDIFDYQKLSYVGFMDFETPQVNDLTKNAGRLHAHFRGDHLIEGFQADVNIELDTIRFWPETYDTLYQTNGSLAFNQGNDRSLGLNLTLGSKEIVRFSSSAEVFDWMGQEKKLYNYPEASVRISAEIDSVLLESLTGFQGSLQLDEFQFNSNGESLDADMRMPSLTVGDVSIHSFVADLESSRHKYFGDVRMDSINNPYLKVDHLSIDVVTSEDSVITFAFNSELPRIQQNLGFGAKLKYLEDGFLVSLDTSKSLQFGDQVWKIMDNKGIFFNTEFDHVNSHLAIVNENQKITYRSYGENMELEIDSLQLNPMAEIFLDSTNLHGTLNVRANYQKQEYSWKANITDIAIDTLALGTLKSEGKMGQKSMIADATLSNHLGFANIALKEQNEVLTYSLSLEGFNLAMVETYIANTSGDMHIKGALNGHVKGKYNSRFYANGYLAFDDVEIGVPEYGFVTKLDKDTVWLEDKNIMLKDFFLTDQYHQQLAINGNIGLSATPKLDLKIISEKYTLLDQENEDSDISGKLSISTDLKINGPLHQLGISGTINTLPSSNITYTYKSAVSLDEREKVITFTSFDNNEIETKKITAKKPSSTINWDVDVNIAKTDLYILIYETTRDYVKLVAEGNLKLSQGIGEKPLLFGEVSSTEGSIFYDAPMVSDLNLKIINASAKWSGEIDKPAISFRGSEIFRVRPKEISQQWDDNQERIPVSVFAIVDEKTIDDFDIHFDLSSSNGKVGNYLQTLPGETREAYAINLLVFGRINANAQSESNSLMQSMVTKLNEISRRNIKNADLNFYMDSQTGTDTKPGETVNKLGYSFSKGLLNKKLRFSVGGNVDFSSDSPQGSKKFNPLGSLQLDYVISESPDITINASRKDVYKGAIDGQVNESSLGISYQKRFHNFFNIFKKKKKE